MARRWSGAGTPRAGAQLHRGNARREHGESTVRVLAATVLSLLVLALAGAGGVLYVFYHYGKGLPEYDQLADYRPPVVTRIHAGDGRLMAEFARQRRVFVPIDAIPKRVVKAFLSAEDQRFYEHDGVDFIGILRAVLTNLRHIGSDRRPVGASTITQQVAKNFLLSNEVSISRKIREIILALRIERTFTKNHILELYLNEIYLGRGSYGVAAAALTYFDKSLDDLTVGEAAFLGGLPKAPNNYDPTRHPQAARARRDYVLNRMVDDGYITRAEADQAMASPVMTKHQSEVDMVRADYFTEEVRRELIDRFGMAGLYDGGLSVRTTLDPHLQKIADSALRHGLSAYDRRHGWRGPMAHISTRGDWASALKKVAFPSDVTEWRPAVVLGLSDSAAQIGFTDGKTGEIPLSQMTWARKVDDKGHRGPAVKKPADVVAIGDVVPVTGEDRTVHDEDKGGLPAGQYALRQIPKINGAVVALDPHTGRVLAMSGGFSADLSEFDRATQAKRQPGSAFKPFVYLAAMDHGFTPSTLVLDAPFVIDQGPGLGRWRPANYEHEFYGPSPLRIGLEKSRNLMTVRLAQKIGMKTIVQYAEKFGITKNLPELLSMALGSGETTLLHLTAAYAMLDNGGKRISPTLIDKIQDRTGKNVYVHDKRTCPACATTPWDAEYVPQLEDNRKQIADPRTTYQVVSMLEGVIQRGTGRIVRSLDRPLAGKTGTTNESRDTWFIGFSPNLVVGVFAGYDTPRPLGRYETGARVSAPIFKEIMGRELKNRPPVPFRVPRGVQLVRVDARTGLPVHGSGNSRSVILEPFLPGTIPTTPNKVIGTANEVYYEHVGTDGAAATRPSLRDIIEGRSPPPASPQGTDGSGASQTAPPISDLY